MIVIVVIMIIVTTTIIILIVIIIIKNYRTLQNPSLITKLQSSAFLLLRNRVCESLPLGRSPHSQVRGLSP